MRDMFTVNHDTVDLADSRAHMCMLSGCHEKKSACRHGSLSPVAGLILTACTRSGN